MTDIKRVLMECFCFVCFTCFRSFRKIIITLPKTSPQDSGGCVARIRTRDHGEDSLCVFHTTRQSFSVRVYWLVYSMQCADHVTWRRKQVIRASWCRAVKPGAKIAEDKRTALADKKRQRKKAMPTTLAPAGLTWQVCSRTSRTNISSHTWSQKRAL